MEDIAPTSPGEGPSPPWKFSARRSRKLGCSNIFTGVNLHQLRRLFQVAGEGDAEHRAKLVKGGVDGGMEGAEEEKKEENQEREEEEEARLAQALVGLRVRARRREGIRAEGHREPKWLRAFGHLRIKEPSVGHIEGGEEGHLNPSLGGLLMGTDEGVLDRQIPREGPLLPPARTSLRRQEGVRDPERYLHRVLHTHKN